MYYSFITQKQTKKHAVSSSIVPKHGIGMTILFIFKKCEIAKNY